MAEKGIRRRELLAAGGVGTAALASGLGLAAAAGAAASPASMARGSARRQVGGGNVLEHIASMNKNFEQHDLSPEGAEMLSGTFTPLYSKVQIAVASAISNIGTARGAILLYVGQPAVPGTRLYDAGGKPRTDLGVAVEWYSVGSVGDESGWASTSYRMVEVDVNPATDVTFQILAGVIGGFGVISSPTQPVQMAITPNGTKGYIANFGAGTVTPVKLGRPGYSFFNDLEPQDEGLSAVATGLWPIDVACDNQHAVVCNFLDGTNPVTIIDVATDTVLRHSSLSAGQNPTSVAISHDGVYAYVATQQGRLFRVTIATGASTSIAVGSGGALKGVAVSSTTAYIGGNVSGNVYRVPVPGMGSVTPTAVGGNVVAVHLAPDGIVWSASRRTAPTADTLQRMTGSGGSLTSYNLPYDNVNDFAISPPTKDATVTPPVDEPVRTAYVVFDGTRWCQFNIGGVFTGQVHTQHLGAIPGPASSYGGVAVNDYGEIWIVRTDANDVVKFPGGRIICRAVDPRGPIVFGEYLDVYAYGHS